MLPSVANTSHKHSPITPHACDLCLVPFVQADHCDAELQHADNYELATFLRQRLAFLESAEGPYAISGAEMRRALSNHSWQLSHSCLSSASPDFEHTPHSGEERHMASCCICAQVLWREQLFDLHLFTAPAEQDGGSGTADDEHSDASNLFPDMRLRSWVFSCRWNLMLRDGRRCPTESYLRQVSSIPS